MAKQVQFRRGTTAEHSSFTGAVGEITVDTTKDTAVVHDGSTAGGIPLAKESAIDAKADLASPTFTGTPAAPTAAADTNTTQIATTAYVQTELGDYATLASPALTGTPAAPTAAADTNTTQIATTAYVQTELGDYATLASPTFSGTPAAPTASTGTNTTQIATTAFVQTEVSALVDSAPATLDTLNELAAALGDDANFSTTVTNSLALKANSADLATVATTGAYSDLSGTPTIPTLSTLGIDNHDDITVDGSGNVLIANLLNLGTSGTPQNSNANLYIKSTIPFIELEDSDGGYGRVYYSNTALIFDADHGDTQATSYIAMRVDDGERVRIEADGDLHADGDVIAYSTTISDARLKDNIVGINNALAKVGQLNGYTFEYKADGKISAGVIAQEVEAVLPEAVTEKLLPLKADDGQEYKVVNYDALHGLLIEAVKELSARVEALEAK